MPSPDFRLFPLERVTRVLSGIAQALRCAGKQIVTSGFRPATEFFARKKFVNESQPARNLNYWALWAGYKF
jgi:hypothetical protein